MKRGRDEIDNLDSLVAPNDEAEARRIAEIAAKAEARALEKNQRPGQTVGVQFLSKKAREELALEKLRHRREEEEKNKLDAAIAHERFVTGQALEDRRRTAYLLREREEQERIRRQREENKEAIEHEHEVKAIRDHYLGVKEARKKIVKPSEKFSRIFQFDWEHTDDTTRDDMNPLYNNRVLINPLYGRGYIAGIDLREQRKDSNYLRELMARRLAEARRHEERDNTLTEGEKQERERESTS
jgi:ATP-dependent RNA helicase DDX23/PRP28